QRHQENMEHTRGLRDSRDRSFALYGIRTQSGINYTLHAGGDLGRKTRAQTRGSGSGVSIHVSDRALDEGLTDVDRFIKLTRGTVRHEAEHARQRQSEDWETRWTHDEREFLAYSEELIDDSDP